MRYIYPLLVAVLCLAGNLVTVQAQSARTAPSQSSHPGTPSPSASFAHLPISFEPNVGQVDRQVAFLAHMGGMTLYLTRSGAILDLSQSTGKPKTTVALPRSTTQPKVKHSVIRLLSIGSSSHVAFSGEQKLPGIVNYFIGNDPKHWHTNIPTYARVIERSVYPGIDQVWYGHNGTLEYDWLVHPGADPARITLQVSGAHALHLDRHGNLVSTVGTAPFIQHAPVVYQTAGSIRHEITSRYVLGRDGSVHLHLGRYDSSRSLVIDPTLAYSTYLGGSGGDSGQGIAVDSAGNAYVTGYASGGFPTTTGAVQTTSGSGYDAFVSKLNPSGSTLLYSTYLGGSGYSYGSGIAVDSAGNAYVTGDTNGGFPTTTGAVQTSYGGGIDNDAFVSKLNPSGNSLLYSTYLGGSGEDRGEAIAIDSAGNAYVTGWTQGGFPTTTGAVQTSFGGGTYAEAFVSKLNPSGSTLLYSTYLGGSGGAQGNGIVVDSTGYAYVTGQTGGGFPTTIGASQTTFGGGSADAFVSKLNPSGSSLLYSTYLGGSGNDSGNGIAVDSAGNAYVTGNTSGTFPTTTGAFQTSFGGGTYADAFVSKLNPSGSSLLYSTYLGGSGIDQGTGIAVDSAGNAYVTGSTEGGFPTTTGAVQTSYGGNADAFVSKLNPSGSSLLYSTYLGGSGNDRGYGIAMDSAGNAYVTGYDQYGGFPTTTGAVQTSYGGGYDAFVSKLTLPDSLSISGPSSGIAGQPATFIVQAMTPATGSYRGTVHFTSSDPTTALPPDYTFTSANAGRHTFTATFNTAGSQTLRVTDTANASLTDSIPVSVTSLPGPPVNVTAFAYDSKAEVSWAPPGNTGNLPITSYSVACSPACTGASVSGTTSIATITGLSNGTAYSFTVTAQNAMGVGPASQPSNTITPLPSLTTPPTLPTAPTTVTASPGNTSAAVSWTAPSSNGGRAITSYTVTCSPFCGSTSVWGGSTSTTITGLTNGTSYTFTVSAVTLVGTGSSSTSNAVTPVTTPSAPTGVSAIPEHASAIVSWTPGTNGGSPIVSFTVTCTPTCTPVTVSATAIRTVVTGLTNGTSYTFAVTATSAVGNSPTSAASAAVTPVALAVSITTGWNLLTVPLQGIGASTASGLVNALTGPGQLPAGSIGMIGVYRSGAFQLYVPGSSDDLTLDPSQGIFVRSSASGTWSPAGTAYTVPASVSLAAGWNLVAAPFPATGLAASAVVAQTSSCSPQEIALLVNGTYQTWTPGSTDFQVPATAGFWILCGSSGSWPPTYGTTIASGIKPQIRHAAVSPPALTSSPPIASRLPSSAPQHLAPRSRTHSASSAVSAANVTSTSAVILWDSTVSEAGTVRYGTSCGSNDSGLTSSVAASSGWLHLAQLSALAPATTYFYAVVSGGQVNDNGGSCFSFRTLPGTLAVPPPIGAVGRVMTGASCSTPVTTGIVTVTDAHTGTTSQPIESSIAGASSANPGTYAVALSPAATPDSSAWFSPQPNDTLTITADTGTGRGSTTLVWSGATNPATMPNICLPVSPPSSNPSISASPSSVPLGSSSTTVSWDTGDGSVGQVYVSLNGGADALLAQGSSGSTSAPWISQPGTYLFSLFAGQSHTLRLTSVTVTRATAPSPSITASPTTVVAPSTSTTITFSTGDGSVGQVYVAMDGGSDVQVTSGASGSVSIPWIQSGHTYLFKLYAGTAHTTLLASVSVTGQASAASISANPTSVPSGASALVTWSTGDGTTGQVFVSMDGGSEAMVTGGASGSVSIPWIQASHTYLFKLYAGTAHTSLLASVSVTGQSSAASISANPTSVPSGTSTVVTWSTGDGTSGQVFVAMDGGSEVQVTSGASGSVTIPWIQPGHTYLFKLFAGTTHATLLASVTVVGPNASSISANPTSVPTSGGSGSTAITFSTGDGSTGQVYVSVNGGSDVLVVQGSGSTFNAPWIQHSGSYVFKLYAGTSHTTVLGQVTVTGQ